jgi:hypothetical protein
MPTTACDRERDALQLPCGRLPLPYGHETRDDVRGQAWMADKYASFFKYRGVRPFLWSVLNRSISGLPFGAQQYAAGAVKPDVRGL